jgi:hypothetical protein
MPTSTLGYAEPVSNDVLSTGGVLVGLADIVYHAFALFNIVPLHS